MTDKPKGGRGKIEHGRNAAVVADRAAGMTYTEIGERYGFTRHRAFHLCKIARLKIAREKIASEQAKQDDIARFNSVESMLASLRDES